MKNFDLNAYSVSELSEIQARDVNGGIVPIPPIPAVFILIKVLEKFTQ